ncbi:MAG: hypothetical protein MJY89_03225 [Bacteroidales bacterium]|nr:hypothetical protein [Bacteroidales bacterium]
MAEYKWNYCSVGGVVRVNIASGEDIAHLGELDQKLWTVLSCPVTGLEFNQKTLDLLDVDKDGKIRVTEVIGAAEWLTSVIKDKDLILKGGDELQLDQINTECEAGRKLYNSAKQILCNLGLEKESISIEDASDSVRIFAKTSSNGDGVITAASAEEDEGLRKIITTISETMGSVVDRSGEAGVDAALIDGFYSELADYSAWQAAAEADKANVFPYGDNTPAALAACDSLKDKIADYFMRCKLIAFDGDVTNAVDISVDRLAAISEKNLATQTEEISSYPLARPSKEGILPFNGINPAWQGAFATLKSLVLDADFAGKEGIDEDEWNATLDKFAAYKAWCAAEKGSKVACLGLDEVNSFLKEDRKTDLVALVEADIALKDEAESIDEVDKLLHFYKYFYKFLKNYVIFTDFYSPDEDEQPVFNAGRLFIDQRCCKLCVRVEDMGKHADMAGLSGMFLIYCECVSKILGQKMNIVAAMTDGGVKNLRPGTNAIFYDRNGQDWDATVIRIVDNPISIKQAFFSPYVKFWDFIVSKINKSASEKENGVISDLQAKADSGLPVPPADGAAAPDKKQQAFDIAKFAGIFAAIGMALGYIGSFLTKVVSGATANPLRAILVLVGIMLCISGPSCFIAWGKLRKRNLGPVLNANGWAINSVVLVNILFGRTLTSVAQYPRLNLKDPYKMKTPVWKKVVRWLIVLIIIAAVVGYFLGCFEFLKK